MPAFVVSAPSESVDPSPTLELGARNNGAIDGNGDWCGGFQGDRGRRLDVDGCGIYVGDHDVDGGFRGG